MHLLVLECARELDNCTAGGLGEVTSDSLLGSEASWLLFVRSASKNDKTRGICDLQRKQILINNPMHEIHHMNTVLTNTDNVLIDLFVLGRFRSIDELVY